MKKIAENLSNNNQWMSTQTTAYSLIAASKFIEKEKPAGGISFTYALNGNKTIEGKTAMSIAQKKLDIEGSASGKLEMKNTGSNMLYARLVLEGTPVAGDETTADNNLRISVVYKDINGQMIDPTRLEQGTNFVCEVTVANPGIKGNYEELALTQIFPSGWEILNSRLDEADFVGENDKPEYQDIRDDRVYSYFDLRANKRKTFKVMLNASYAGRFYLPAITCEAMYDNTINARKPGKWINVLKPGVQ